MSDILFQDEQLLIVTKPAGLLSVPGRGEDKQDCLSARIQQRLPDALVVHRLDMATSGLMVFARGEAMQRELSRMFREREVTKRYIALVAGIVGNEAGEIDLPLSVDWPNRPKSKVDHASGKHSLTRYRLLSVDSSSAYQDKQAVSRVELEPVTGRTHQLRLHMQAIGHPILGDALYGVADSAPRLLLHACSLGFSHPASGEPLNFVSAPPF